MRRFFEASSNNPNEFTFNIHVSNDDCNLQVKTYKGVKVNCVMIMDLPEMIRYKNNFIHIPEVILTKTDAAGYTGIICRPLIEEINQLAEKGFKFIENGEEITIKVKFITIFC